jgi:hypothetical protein
MASLVFVSDDELLERMGGEYPPSDPEQRAAYFSIAFTRLTEAHGEEWAKSAQLLAGLAPDLLSDFWQEQSTRRRDH